MADTGKGYVNTTTDGAGVTVIAFYHPAQNSLPGVLLGQLTSAIQAASANNETRVIILKSDGDKAFCAGANFDELLQIKTLDEAFTFFSGFANVINACRTSSKIIIGRVHGKAVGGGIGIAAACDHCFATANASIKLSELSIGIGPFVIEPAVTRKIGISAFSQPALNAGEFYTAQWAQAKGLYAEVFDTVAAMDLAINNMAAKIAGWSPAALAELKNTLWQGTENWGELLKQRAAISGRLVLSAEAQNALNALKRLK